MDVRKLIILPLVLFAFSCNETGSNDSATEEVVIDVPNEGIGSDNSSSDSSGDSSTPDVSESSEVCTTNFAAYSGSLADENQLLNEFSVYQGTDSALDNYDYYSSSAHPLIGPTPQARVAQFFIYQNDDGYYLNFVVDEDNSSTTGGAIAGSVVVTDNSDVDDLVIADEGSEVTASTVSSTEARYDFSFNYARNTDGFVIGPISGVSLKIQVQIDSSSNVDTMGFYAADGFFDVSDSSILIALRETCE